MGKRVGMSQSKISKIETGRVLPAVLDVERILTALQVDEQTSERLLILARAANTEFRSWRSYQRFGLHHKQRELAAIEGGSKSIRFFLPAVLTGLLHTPEYARSSLYRPVTSVSGDRSKALAARLERQQALYDTGRNFTFIITESAARWRLVDPPAMALQLDRLISLSRMSNINLGVIPLNVRMADVPLSTFVIYDDRLVTVETLIGELVLKEPRDITYFHALFQQFHDHAHFGDPARELLSAWADDFRRE